VRLDEYYKFGAYANRPDDCLWNPDSRESINQHMLLCGGSGAGKTTLLKKIARYLTFRNKHIFIFDLKGDMVIKDDDGNILGNYIEFTAWDSKYGINPFEFDMGLPEDELKILIEEKIELNKEQKFKVQNSGPRVQVERIIEIIKKNFLPNMGANQKDVLMYLLLDTYSSKGFIYNDINTWLNEIPSLKDTLDLINRIKSFAYKNQKAQIHENSVDFIINAQQKITDIQLMKKNINEEDTEESKDIEKKIDIKSKELKEDFDKYVEYGVENFNPADSVSNDDWFSIHNIDIDKYLAKAQMRTVEKLSSYISALVDAGVFHSSKPPVKNGLNVVNISGLDVSIQRFIVDVWLGKVFKSCKIRGTYSEREHKPRGEKCDTYAFIDESKLIAGNSRDKNDPFSYLNRIATEARGYGFGLVVAAQSAEHFPPEFLKNFDAQVVLNTGIADFDSVRKSFGIDKKLLEFTQLGWGHALVKTGKIFSKVKMEL